MEIFSQNQHCWKSPFNTYRQFIRTMASFSWWWKFCKLFWWTTRVGTNSTIYVVWGCHIVKIYDDFSPHISMNDRVVLTPTNNDALEINNKILDNISGEKHIYYSVDLAHYENSTRWTSTRWIYHISDPKWSTTTSVNFRS